MLREGINISKRLYVINVIFIIFDEGIKVMLVDENYLVFVVNEVENYDKLEKVLVDIRRDVYLYFI